jgi:hypothetical protein
LEPLTLFEWSSRSLGWIVTQASSMNST